MTIRDLFGPDSGVASLATALAVGLSSLAVLSLPVTAPVARWAISTIRLKMMLLLASSDGGGESERTNGDKEEGGGGGDGLAVSGLFVHPVKSMRSVSLSESTLDRKGLTDDRRFMVVVELPPPRSSKPRRDDDATHRFLSQRRCPSLATLSATIVTVTAADDDDAGEEGRVLVLSHGPSSSTIRVPCGDGVGDSPPRTHLAGIWDDVVAVDDLGDEAADFLQAIVDADEEFSVSVDDDDDDDDDGNPKTKTQRVRLVREAAASRALDYGRDRRSYVPGFAKTWTGGFLGKPTLTDGFPILIASEASLEALNARLKEKGEEEIPMSRFRPNIVVKGGEPFQEDRWKTVVIGTTVFAIVKGCPRCKQSCTDQTTGRVSPRMEPLRTMTSFRRSSGDRPKNGSVFFAQNAIPIGRLEGRRIRVGDPVRVLETGDPVFVD